MQEFLKQGVWDKQPLETGAGAVQGQRKILYKVQLTTFTPLFVFAGGSSLSSCTVGELEGFPERLPASGGSRYAGIEVSS